MSMDQRKPRENKMKDVACAYEAAQKLAPQKFWECKDNENS